MFRKLLIANRGEIAVRIIRSAQELGIPTVAIYSDADRGTLPTTMADEAYELVGDDISSTYLNISQIISIAQQSGADAVHPGYGFLSENSTFIQACQEANITFVGPSEEAIRMMGNKLEARAFAKKLGVPVPEGITGTQEEILAQQNELPYPILAKAAAGGGGKGMRIVRSASALKDALISTSREAKAYFGDATVYIEKYLEEPRHIEFQLLGDQHGNLVHLFERECSLQRRYQKIIEEAPSPTLTPELRTRMAEAALKLGKAINYYNAGTIEFLVDTHQEFYFLEMNTRVQVEHPVTEMTTGVDIVAEQLRVAAGQKLSFTQGDLRQEGHAIECRVYAENPEQNFLPSPGKITYYHAPASVRLDTAVTGTSVIESQYDPMISKMIVYSSSREECIQRSILALEQYVIHGIETNIAYLRALLRSEDFQQNTISTKYCDEKTPEIIKHMEEEKQALDKFPVAIAGLIYNLYSSALQSTPSIWTEIGFWRHIPTVAIEIDGESVSLDIYRRDSNYEVHHNDTPHQVHNVNISDGQVDFLVDETAYTYYVSSQDDLSQQVSWKTYKFHWRRNDLMAEGRFSNKDSESSISDDRISSPMPGKVIQLNVKVGDQVKRGETLLIVEAMKMENQIIAPRDAQVKEVRVEVSGRVDKDEILIELG
ncbi:acetyl/propionyl/methylcrotonyl-CoA carboxylase subunit alpha [Tunicatimonas pelagia]|uniref:acetyl/propionyl/methylcrotonyl-CoA carboxylase subunit alpha n=1 Tax=Tunicatimonas pelagia TaxID=931531 RepID=UPI002666C2DF|nr:biotin carboxylase N-terminal domain-containing protein [Tunicatimonas pelagia]WKN42013.1 biotin carboxylase N-terminal domain-containing protein [Tunicatimonas pelagia]